MTSFRQELCELRNRLRGTRSDQDDQIRPPLLNEDSASPRHEPVSAPEGGDIQPHADEGLLASHMFVGTDIQPFSATRRKLRSHLRRQLRASSADPLVRSSERDQWHAEFAQRRSSTWTFTPDLSWPSYHQRVTNEQIKQVEAELCHHRALQDAVRCQENIGMNREAEEASDPAHVKCTREQLNRELAKLYLEIDVLASAGIGSDWALLTRQRAECLGRKLPCLRELDAALQELTDVTRQQTVTKMKPWYGRAPGCNKPSRAQMQNHFNKRHSALNNRLRAVRKELLLLDLQLGKMLWGAIKDRSAKNEQDIENLTMSFKEL